MSHNRNSDMHSTEEARKTLALLETMRAPEAHHLFRARLMQRIEEEAARGGFGRSGAMASMNYRLAFMLLLIVINLGSALLVLLSQGTESTPSIGEMISSFGDDYSSSTFAYYQEPAATYAPATEEAAPADLQGR